MDSQGVHFYFFAISASFHKPEYFDTDQISIVVIFINY